MKKHHVWIIQCLFPGEGEFWFSIGEELSSRKQGRRMLKIKKQNAMLGNKYRLLHYILIK